MRKRFILFFVFVILNISLFAAARFWVGGGSSANWNATGPTNWAATSGGANNQSVPGASDDVTFDGVGTNANTNSTLSTTFTILSLTFGTGYTATVTINNNQSVTIAGNFTDQTQHTWSIATPTQSNLGISATSTITSNGKTYPGGVIFSGTSTKTLSGDWTIGGTLVMGANTQTLNSGTLNCAGLTMTVACSGTTIIRLTGGSWTGLGALTNSVTLAGNVTLANGSTLTWGTGTLTYESGTITTTNNTLAITTSATMNTNGMTWNAITPTGSITVTINSLLTVTTLTNSQTTMTYAGTAGFTATTWTVNPTGVATMTLKNGITYTVTSSFQAFTTRTGSILLFTSDHATNKANITVNSGAVLSVLADFTRIDASGGRTINTFHGTLTSTINVFSYTDYGGGLASYLFIQ